MIRLALPLGLAALLASCTVGPDYRTPPILTGQTPAPELVSGREAAYDALAPLPANWWRLYDNPLLNGLVEKALVRNTDLRKSLADLEQMRAMLTETETERTPQTSLSASATEGGARVETGGVTTIAKPTPLYDVSEMVSYDLDLFGKITREIEEGRANVEESKAMLDLMRVNTAAQTASAYSQACAAGLNIAVTNRSIAVAKKMVYVAQRRFDAGVAAFNNVVQSRTTLLQTEAMLPSLVAEQRKQLFMLATLTGDPPSAFPPDVAMCKSPPLMRRKIPIGDGAALLARRPDVRSAERKLAAAIADIGVKTAQLYPSVKLTGSVEGVKTNALGTVTKLLTYGVGPSLSWDFPNLSPARARIAESNAAARSALASFDGYLLTGLREAETALVTLARDLDAERLDVAARNSAATAYANELRLYTGGIGQFNSVLDAENTSIEAESTLARATAQVSKDQITLFMALGGGWQDAPAVMETPLDRVVQN